jgi:nucleoside-triphosphatase
MLSERPKILLTGLPGCGKTTAVMRVIENFDPKKMSGFYTQEIRRRGSREGFKWKCLDGREGTLSHINIKGRARVGRYGIDVEGFEKSVVPVLEADAELIVIDEIGKMECFSEKFAAVVRKLFKTDKAVLATIALKGGGLISEVKKNSDVKMFNLNRQNRDEVIAEISQLLWFLKGK